eukprot:COSAG04_NODE_6399_length_1335_cov_17.445793_1_plen_64_part_10
MSQNAITALFIKPLNESRQRPHDGPEHPDTAPTNQKDSRRQGRSALRTVSPYLRPLNMHSTPAL